MAQKQLVLRATMIGHNDWVTAIATPTDNSDMFVTSSRDKSVILWMVTKEDKTTWLPRRRLTGHSHFVQDVALSSDGQFALSGSCDGELRFWDLQAGTTVRRFGCHIKDVLSVAYSIDNRQSVSASRDKTINCWNTLGECKYTIQGQDAHSDWVSCVRFSPSPVQPSIVSGSRDKTVNTLNVSNGKISATLTEHGGYVNTVAVSPDGSVCASGGEDGVILLWGLPEGKRLYSLEWNSIIHSLCFFSTKYWVCAATEAGIKILDLESKDIVVDLRVQKQETTESKNKFMTVAVSPDGSVCASGGEDGVILLWGLPEGERLYSLESNSIIHSLCFCPNKYWVCAATEAGIKIWDLESKSIVVDLKQGSEMVAIGEQSAESKNKVIYCTSLNWSADGSTLFSGYTDGVIRVWTVGY